MPRPGWCSIEVIYDATALGGDAPLRDPDDLTVHPMSGACSSGRMPTTSSSSSWRAATRRVAAPFLQLVGHGNRETGAPGQDPDVVTSSSWAKESEITGLASDPSSTRLYVTSQRGRDGEHGMTFEISGPLRPAA